MQNSYYLHRLHASEMLPTINPTPVQVAFMLHLWFTEFNQEAVGPNRQIRVSKALNLPLCTVRDFYNKTVNKAMTNWNDDLPRGNVALGQGRKTYRKVISDQYVQEVVTVHPFRGFVAIQDVVWLLRARVQTLQGRYPNANEATELAYMAGYSPSWIMNFYMCLQKEYGDLTVEDYDHFVHCIAPQKGITIRDC